MADIISGGQEEAAKEPNQIMYTINVTHFTLSVNTNVKFPKKHVAGLSG